MASVSNWLSFWRITQEGFKRNFPPGHFNTAARGFWERHRNDFAAGQIAQRLNLVVYVDHDEFGPGAE